MDKFLALVISGAVSGAIYSLIASGMALTYATTRIFNLGFGAVAFSAAFLYYELNSGLGWPTLWAAATTLIVAGPLLGWLLSKLILGGLSGASDSAKVMAVVGILIALPAVGRFLVEILVNDFGVNLPLGDQIYLMPGVGPSPVEVFNPVGTLTVNSDQLIVFVVAAVMAVALWVLLRRTRLGLQMRAATDRPDLASLMGINTGLSTTWAWVIGTTLACTAGIVGAPILNTLNPQAYVMVVFVSTAAVVLAGFTSIPQAFAAGLFLGIAQNLVAGYASFASSINGFQTSVPFVVLLVALAVRGRSRERLAGSVAETVLSADLGSAQSRLRRNLGWLVPSLLLFCVVFFLADDYWLSVLTGGLALSVVFMSFVVVVGLGGMVSLAQAAFVSASGLTAGLLLDHYHYPWLVAFIGGTLVSALLGAVVALPALRVGGLALTLATLALAFLGDSVLFQWTYLRGGNEGWSITRPKLGGLDFADDRTYAVALLLVVLVVAWLVNNLIRSSSGRQMIAVRASEPAAASAGISPSAVKLRLFVISSAIAGAGGVLVVTADRSATNITYVTQVGLVWLATVVLLGVRKPMAAVVAGLFATVFPAFLSNGFTLPGWLGGLSWGGTQSTWLPMILFGLGAISMAQNPEGALGATRATRRRKSTKNAADQRGPSPATASAAGELSKPVVAPVVVDMPSSDRPTTLRLSGVRAGYGELEVLAGIDLTLQEGTITALVGANGAGKSTLCKTIAGLVLPHSGTISLAGNDVTSERPHRRAGRVLLAPEARGVFPSMSVEDNLSVRLRQPSERARIYEQFPVLRERRQVAAGSLSGGEQQILTMAPLLCKPPTVLLADEPTLGLAPRIVEQLIALFDALRAQGTTLLLAEERAKGIIDIADQVILMELGRIVWSGPRERLDRDQLAAIFLGSAGEVVAASERSVGSTSMADAAVAPAPSPT